MKKLITVLLALFVLSACGDKEVKMTFKDSNESGNVASLVFVPDYEGKLLDVAYKNSASASEIEGQLGEEYFARFEEIVKEFEGSVMLVTPDVGFTVTLSKDGETETGEAGDFKDFYDEVVDLLTQAEPV